MAKKLHYGRSTREIGVEECVMEWDCVVCNSIFSWLVLAVILLHRMFVEIIPVKRSLKAQCPDQFCKFMVLTLTPRIGY